MLFSSSAADAATCTLVQVPDVKAAKLKVYFTKFLKEDTTRGKYRTCRVVKKVESDSETFFLTPFRQDANLVVHPSNWPAI